MAVDERVLLDRYELLDPLGRGGMATVFRALDRRLNREVAVKLFAPGTAVDDARRSTEAQALARLSHPNLVALYDAHLAVEGDATPSFLIMELVDGVDLQRRLQHGPLPSAEAADVAVGIAQALAVVHEAGMVHRDLKPGNILLADSRLPDGHAIVKLADFGIAHLLGAEHLTTTGTVIGTASYLSPEQIFGKEPGPAADVYALGLVVLEALTGVREYPGTPAEAVAARAAREPRIPASLPEGWRVLLSGMTATDPELRPTATETAATARAIAPQLADWEPEHDEHAQTQAMGTTLPTEPLAAPAGTGPTRVMGTTLPTRPLATLSSAASTRVLPAPGPADAGSRRRRVVIAAAVAAAIVAAAAALALGSTSAPHSQRPHAVPTTSHPTANITSPASTVPPVERQTSAPGQQPKQQGPQKQPPPHPGPAKPHAPTKAVAPKPAHAKP